MKAGHDVHNTIFSPDTYKWDGPRSLYCIRREVSIELRSHWTCLTCWSGPRFTGQSGCVLNACAQSFSKATPTERKIARMIQLRKLMMTSSNGNILRVTGPLWGEFTGHQWIPITKASDAEFWCFLLSAPEQAVESTVMRLVIWDSIVPNMTSL